MIPTAIANSANIIAGYNTEQKRMELGIIGASGFVGLRTLEVFSAIPDWKVRPIVRSASSLAVIARRRVDWRVADLLSTVELVSALSGCNVCVHAAIGDASQIVRMAQSTYRACALAGVKRLIWLSSASVHGQNPLRETDDDTPLKDSHPIRYNNAKVRAEWMLERCARDGAVEVVRLRPSVVFGPRSRWISDASDSFRTGRAAWINRGQGLCNTVYVDNLIEAIRLSSIHPRAPGQAYLIGDENTITWREFFLPIAKHRGFDESVLSDVPPPVVVAERETLLSEVRVSPAYAFVCTKMPERVKRIVKGTVNGWSIPFKPRDGWCVRKSNEPVLTLEMALLQQCEWVLSSRKARETLGYVPRFSFSEGMKRSLTWLDFLQ